MTDPYETAPQEPASFAPASAGNLTPGAEEDSSPGFLQAPMPASDTPPPPPPSTLPAPPTYAAPTPPGYSAPPPPPAYAAPAPPSAPAPYSTPASYGAPAPYGAAPSYAPPAPGNGGADSKNWMGIVSIIAPFVGFGLPGIIFGHMGLRAAKRGEASNRGLALAGTIVSWVVTLLVFIGVVASIAIPIFLTQRLAADDASAKADLTEVSMAVSGALVETGEFPEVTFLGDEVLVGAETVTLESDASALSFVPLSESSYCIDIVYGEGLVFSRQDDGTFREAYCSGSAFVPGDDDAAGDDTTGADDGAQGGVEAFSLFVGECFLNPYEGQDANADGTFDVNGYIVVPCDQPHYGEVFAVQATALPDFDLDAIVSEANDLCYNAFEPYVGINYDESSLFADTYYPTTESWEMGDRDIICAIAVETSDAVGSLAGSGQ